MLTIYRTLRRALIEYRRFILWFAPGYRLRRLFFGYAVARVNNSLMYLDLKHDTGISKDLYIFHKREHLSTDYLMTQDILKKGDVVLDVGANIGYYALIESKLVGEDGSVHAIEPVSNNYRLLLKNISLNDLHNITTYNLAAGDVNKEADILVAEKGNFSSFTRLQGERYSGTERVRVVTLDDFAREHSIEPALVRMDVEGYETEIIKGMTGLLARRPKLLIEVHPHLVRPEELDMMFATLESHGYTQATVIKEKKDVWMMRNGDIRPLLRFISAKIEKDGDTAGTGKIERMDIPTLRQSLSKRGSAFHALLS